MFKSAAAKIAHNSTLPALGASKDLRPLQDLITAEKAVLQSLQRLSADIIKSSDCLKAWGAYEGDDLSDTLAASQQLLGYIASAFAQLAGHERTVRDYMKGVRTREENLDEMRKRRKNTISRADAAEKKLSKMNPEHKSLPQQTELLNSLRDQIRNMDWDIMCEEARLGDFKRTSTKNWMMLKFGGFLECAEKATIVGELGKLVIEEIPLEQTQPGQSRALYAGHEKTTRLLEEAQRCISEVVFDPQPVTESPISAAFQQPPRLQQQFTNAPQHPGYPEPSHDAPQLQDIPSSDMESGFRNQSSQDYLSLAPLGSPTSTGVSSDAYGHRVEYSQTYATQNSHSGPATDEFGFADWRGGPNAYTTMPGGASRYAQQYDQSGSSPTSPVGAGPSNNSHFATFPVGRANVGVNQNQGYQNNTTQQPQSPYGGIDEDYEHGRVHGHERDAALSFSAGVANALSADPRFIDTNLVGGANLSRDGSISTDAGPLPRYESHYYSPIVATGLPKGAAPPRDMSMHVANPSVSSLGVASGSQDPKPPAFGSLSKDRDHRFSQTSDMSSELPYVSEESDDQDGRDVHFGAKTTIDDQYGHGDRSSSDNNNNDGEKAQTYLSPGNDTLHRYSRDSEYTDDDEGTVHGAPTDHEEQGPRGVVLPTKENYTAVSNTSTANTETDVVDSRLSPLPETNVRLDNTAERDESVAKGYDEVEVNATAAREVAKEMEALGQNLPLAPATPVARTPSPLVPPAPPFAQQSPSRQYTTESAVFGQSPPRLGVLGGGTSLPPLPPGARSATPPAPFESSPPLGSRSPLGLGMPSSSSGPIIPPMRSTSYNTPMDYSSSPTGQIPYRIASSSIPSSPPMTPMIPGSRTISASAFKRPQSRSPGGGPRYSEQAQEVVAPLSVRKKPLPVLSPGLESGESGSSGSGGGDYQLKAESPLAGESYEYLASMVDYNGTSSSGSRQGASASANVNSPLPPPPGAQQGHAPGEIPASTSAGYGSGKFSTNLEDLR